MKTVCLVGSDYLCLPEEECTRAFDRVAADCNYYRQKEDDPDHPSELPRVCGNCLHWAVVDWTKPKEKK